MLVTTNTLTQLGCWTLISKELLPLVGVQIVSVTRMNIFGQEITCDRTLNMKFALEAQASAGAPEGCLPPGGLQPEAEAGGHTSCTDTKEEV